MGVHYTVVNYDRREYFSPHAVNSGAKVGEMSASGRGVGQALVLLLACRWRGDRVALLPDEYDPLHELEQLRLEFDKWTDIGDMIGEPAGAGYAAQAGTAACFEICVQHQCAWYHARGAPGKEAGECAVLALARYVAAAPQRRG